MHRNGGDRVHRGAMSAAARQPAAARELVVFAAASLTEAFTALGDTFAREHGIEVVLRFAGSQMLARDILRGVRADVFASADRVQMELATRRDRAGPSVLFARNEPVVVIPRGSRAVLAFPGLRAAERIVIGVPDVPIGRYTRQILARATVRAPHFYRQVHAQVTAQESDVRQVLARIACGHADAGFVYRTDARMATDAVDVVPIPQDVNVIAEYPITALRRAHDPDLATAWVDYVRSPAGQQVLARFGFAAPEDHTTR